MDVNFGELILESLRANGGKTLLHIQNEVDETIRLSGHELEEKVNLRIRCLKKKPGQAILLIPFGVEHLSWMIALMARGSSVVYYPKKELLKRILIGKRTTLVLPEAGNWFISLMLRIMGHRSIRFSTKSLSSEVLRIDHHKDIPALVSYSSGTGHTPKKIKRSHEVLYNQHIALKKAFAPFEHQIDFPLFPNILLHNLACGVETCLPALDWDNWQDFFPGNILDQMQKEKVNTLTGNFYYFVKLVGAALQREYHLDHIQAVGIGGSPIPDWLLDDMQKVFPNARIFVIYGSTEAEPICIREFKRRRNPMHGYCVGLPHPDIQLEIKKIGETEQHDSVQDWGEISVKGPHVVNKTANGFDTGDIGYIHDGELYLIGRRDNMGDYMGVFPFQIEHYLSDQVELEDIAVIVENETLRVFYTSDQNLDEEIHEAVENAMGKIPCAIKRLFEIPKDARHHSKTLYKKLYADHISRS